VLKPPVAVGLEEEVSTLPVVFIGIGLIILHIGMYLSFLGNPFNLFAVICLVTPIVLLIFVYW
jgi:hypothetical protein